MCLLIRIRSDVFQVIFTDNTLLIVAILDKHVNNLLLKI